MAYIYGLSKEQGDEIKAKFTYRPENFIPAHQLRTMRESDEHEPFFKDIEKYVMQMPIYREDSHRNADGSHKAYLKYFGRSGRYYIYNRDCSDEQIETFGSIPGQIREMGMIRLSDLFIADPWLEMDLYFEPGDVETD